MKHKDMAKRRNCGPPSLGLVLSPYAHFHCVNLRYHAEDPFFVDVSHIVSQRLCAVRASSLSQISFTLRMVLQAEFAS